MHYLRSTKPMALDSPENIPGLAERIYIAHRTMRFRRRTTGEHIILAGDPRQGAQGRSRIFPKPAPRYSGGCASGESRHRSPRRGIYRHNVGRVIRTFTRIELATHEPKPLPVPTPFSCLLQ
jgi:hypothetical protein